jgi:replicative DNA helicase
MTYDKLSQLEDKIIAFLITLEREELRAYLGRLKGLTFSTRAHVVLAMAKDYIKSEAEYTFSEFLINDLLDRRYLTKLLTVEMSFSSAIGDKNIKEFAELQQRIALKKKIQKLDNQDPNSVLKEIKKIQGILDNKPKKLSDVSKLRIKDRALEEQAPSTGYDSLDKIIKGFVPSRLYTMTGQTNVGKSTIACNFAHRVAKQGKKVLYFALEPDISIINYLASIWCNKRFDDLTTEDLTPPDFVNDNIDIYTKENIENLDEMIDIVENSPRYDLIIIDHFGYFVNDSKNTIQSEKNSMKTMALFAKRMKTAVFLIVHPRKPSGAGKKQKELTIHDISGSAAFSQDATDVLIFGRKKDENDPLGVKYTNEGVIIVHKTKSGPNGGVRIRFIDGSAVILEESEYASRLAGAF